MFIIIWQEIKDAFPFLFEEIDHAYFDGMRITFIPGNTNTGPPVDVKFTATDRFTPALKEVAKAISIFGQAGAKAGQAMREFGMSMNLATVSLPEMKLGFRLYKVTIGYRELINYEVPAFTFKEHLEDCFRFII